MSEFDLRKGLGITLLAGAIIALSGCTAESETAAADEAEPTITSTAGSGDAPAAAASLASGTAEEDPQAEARRAFEAASRAALAAARSAAASQDKPVKQKKEPVAPVAMAAADAAAPAPTGGFGVKPSSAAASPGLGTTSDASSGTRSGAAKAAPAASASVASAPSFNMTGGSPTTDAVRPAKPPAAPAAASTATLGFGAAVPQAPARPSSANQAPVKQAPATQVPVKQVPVKQAPAANASPSNPNVAPAAPAAARTAGRTKDAAAADGVVLEPAVLEFGEIPLGDSKIARVRLINNSDFGYKLIDCRATCGCTTTECPKGDVIPPNGGSLEVEIKLDGGERPQRLRKTVSFLISDQHPPLRLGLNADAVSYIDITPERFDRGDNPDGTVTISAADGTPFRILSMFPTALMPDDFSTEAKAEHVVTIPWDTLYETGSRQRNLLFRLDHPKADRVLLPLSVNAQRDMRERQRANADAAGNAAGQPSVAARDLNGMLERGEYDAVLALIANDEVAINQPDKARHTPMIKAARYGAVEVMMALADKGSNLEAVDGMGRTPISYAAQSGSYDAVLTLIDLGANVNHVDQTGNTPLGWAAGFGTVGMCEAMIEAGAKVNAGSGTLLGFTPLIWASMASTDVDKVKLLIENKADLEARDTMEQATVVMHAIRTNMMDNVKALVDAGAKLDVTDARGRTPLHIAAGNGAPDAKMIAYLLGKGLDPTAVTRKGETPLDLARNRRDSKAPEVIAALEAAMGG